MLDQIIVAVVTTALTIITAVCTTVLIPRLGDLLKSKTHNQTLMSAITELTQAAQVTVDGLNQKLVNSCLIQ